MDTAIERKPEKGFPDAYTAEVIYWDADNRERYEGTFNLDLGIYWGLTQIDRRDLHDIHKRLDEISKTLKSWSAGGRGLLTLSPNEQRERSEEMIERHRERVAAREAEIKTEDEEASEDEDADADADESTNQRR